MMTDRDVHFAQFAQLVARDLTEAGVFFDGTGEGQHIIAQRAYDLLQSGCVAINNAQMQQGARIHPHAMLRAVQDLTQWPD